MQLIIVGSQSSVNLYRSLVCSLVHKEMEAVFVTRPPWTSRDTICLGLAVIGAMNVIMCLWVAATSTSTARRQASAVVITLAKASMIDFNLTLEPRRNAVPLLHVSGRLYPRFTECSRRLYFDGRMLLTTPNASEVFVLTNHRGYRHALESSSVNATCLTTQDLPPLHTLADIVPTAFRPQAYEAFAMECKPLQVLYYDMPFILCAEDWLRATLRAHELTHSTSTDEQVETASDPTLIVHGKTSALEIVMRSNGSDSLPIAETVEHCEYLDAPMTSGQACWLEPIRCPGPHVEGCKEQVKA
ncbi:hypothetical protein PsorP6_014525 [Peronosclerospora sorghi]|uniref:Uncharacterized protein n=1 Tax=Peronosclerospora sorghi TaxID=230839 RepID=A0ACC0VSD7_9STRA|nr:hypothetical protein PsorP6_014525 [Peronosclerospora sorghi]